MPTSSGSIVGDNKMNPTVKFTVSGNKYYIDMCLNRSADLSVLGTSGAFDIPLQYRILLPKRVSCDLNLLNAMTEPDTVPDDMQLWGLNVSNDTWERVDNGDGIVTVLYGYNVENDIACFNQIIVAASIRLVDQEIGSDKVYCDFILCIEQDFTLPPCKYITGCENFCVKTVTEN